MPIENVVVPAGPSAPVVPILSPSGGSTLSSSYGGFDLQGALPLLPSPVPGLLGGALSFVGKASEAVEVKPVSGSAQVAESPVKAQPGRAFDKTPAVPAKPVPGNPSLAISRDRKSAASTHDRALSSPRVGDGGASVDPAIAEGAQADKAAGLGRRFFDQSSNENRGAIEEPSASAKPSFLVAATVLGGGAFGPAYKGTALSPSDPQIALGGGHGSGRHVLSYSPDGETLRDAVASVVPVSGAPVPGGSAAGAFGAAAPNGELSAPESMNPAAVFSVPGAPRPLAIDLSRSGLVVRVRSALNGVMGLSSPASFSAPALGLPAPSTALLERGGMLEAFSVSRAYADGAALKPASEASSDRTAKRGNSGVFGLEPSGSSTASLWWAWLILPLFIAAFRGL